jgi:hypothetical protein
MQCGLACPPSRLPLPLLLLRISELSRNFVTVNNTIFPDTVTRTTIHAAVLKTNSKKRWEARRHPVTANAVALLAGDYWTRQDRKGVLHNAVYRIINDVLCSSLSLLKNGDNKLQTRRSFLISNSNKVCETVYMIRTSVTLWSQVILRKQRFIVGKYAWKSELPYGFWWNPSTSKFYKNLANSLTPDTRQQTNTILT